MTKVLASLFALIISTAVVAASDLPTKYTPPLRAAEIQTINWTGPWVGVIVGYGWKNESTTIAGNDKTSQYIMSHNLFPGVIGLRPDGATIGGRIGYDWQFNPQFLVGLLVDWSYSGMRDSQYAGGNLVGVSYNERITNIGDVLARVGYLVGQPGYQRALLYVQGGGTWATIKNDVTSSGILPAFGVAPAGSSSDTRWGWSLGAGLEYRLDKTWSVDLSYLHSWLGTQDTLVSATYPCGKGKSCATSWTNSEDVRIQRVLLGINARF